MCPNGLFVGKVDFLKELIADSGDVFLWENPDGGDREARATPHELFSLRHFPSRLLDQILHIRRLV